MNLGFQIRAKIGKPRGEVFAAVQDPIKLSKYFTTGGASGPLQEGKTVIWRFADYPDNVPVRVKKVVPENLIALEWDAENGNGATSVEMAFEALTPQSTLVAISESGWRETQSGLDSSYMNCQGWMNMACCLKAWLEYGINLREGFF
jgi:uncharacterized protein YndB with AHSA1/START domain